MAPARHSKERPAARRWLAPALLLAGALALIASGAPAAWAGPAQEEYRLDIPDARGGDGTADPERARSELGRGSEQPPTSSLSSPAYRDHPYRDHGVSGGEDPLLAKPGLGADDSGLLSAGASAAGKTPAGLAVLAALLLITVAGALAVRRRGRVKAGP